jgi:hypothetical protein
MIHSDTKMLSSECSCPCGGGQSCIVDRRELNDWVHEDDIFGKNKLPLRKNCYQEYTEAQLIALDNFMKDASIV